MISFVRFREENKVITELKNVKRSTHIRDRHDKEIFEDDIMIVDTEDGLLLCKVVFREGKEGENFLSGLSLKTLKELDREEFDEDLCYFDIVEGLK